MRKIILIAAITVASATASVAGPSRSLSLASSETGQPAAGQPKTEQKAELPPPAVERPKLAVPQGQTKAPAVADKPDNVAEPRRKHLSMEARVIYQLHRHGIYW
ncbi:MAG: hypothetical protein E7813_01700 [Bradyrhizobium sp.]|uniref:hypothetical protein n=1 Tax=Bradyrhizobium sp. TaxID=376 RepID=UPI001205FA38|nr:hypothetical protein [Bradyrhizobium sp.]THD75197.1 MAG: hypothetical protein E7813_01700 [Bradyrhizobium sp.]